MKSLKIKNKNILNILIDSTNHLNDKAKDMITNFLISQINPNGGFKDRYYKSDLYYTFFGLISLIALKKKIPENVRSFVNDFRDYDNLDFIHLVSLLNCKKFLFFDTMPMMKKKLIYAGEENQIKNLSFLIDKKTKNIFKEILNKIDEYKSLNGGYNHEAKNSIHSTAYGNYLALQAFQLSGFDIEDTESLIKSTARLKTHDGGYSNIPYMNEGSVNATSAALMILNNFEKPVDDNTIDWLLSCMHPQGGFRASRNTVIPDLLTTATAVYSLKSAGYNLENIKEKNLLFLNSLWDDNSGGFCGNLFDDKSDCEYTFYGLLLLGCLKG